MIQQIRDAHFSIVKVMVVGLPILFISGLIARNAPAHQAPVNQVFQSRPLEVVWAASESFRADGVKVQMRRSEGGEFVELQSKAPIVEPDLFAYWAPSAPAGNAIPEKARLLGAFLPQRAEIYRLLEDERGKGRIWIYGLAHQRVLGSIANRNSR